MNYEKERVIVYFTPAKDHNLCTSLHLILFPHVLLSAFLQNEEFYPLLLNLKRFAYALIHLEFLAFSHLLQFHRSSLNSILLLRLFRHRPLTLPSSFCISTSGAQVGFCCLATTQLLSSRTCLCCIPISCLSCLYQTPDCIALI